MNFPKKLLAPLFIIAPGGLVAGAIYYLWKYRKSISFSKKTVKKQPDKIDG